jgi:hypothetical protein
MAGRAATVLATLVSQISLVRLGMGEVSGRRVVHHGLGDLAEGGHQTVDQDEDQQETHRGPMLAGHGSDGQGNKSCLVRAGIRRRWEDLDRPKPVGAPGGARLQGDGAGSGPKKMRSSRSRPRTRAISVVVT